MTERTTSRMLSQFAALLLLIIAFLTSPVLAQNPPGGDGKQFTMKQAMAYALRNQRSIENAKFETYIAEKRVKELVGIGLPQISFSGNYTQYTELPVSVIDIRNFDLDPTAPGVPEGLPDSIYFQTANFGIRHNATGQADLSQLIFDGSWIVGLQAAKEFKNLNEINLERTKEQAAVQVAKAYYNALVGEERSKLLDANVERLRGLLTSTEALYKNGFAEKVDVDRLRIQLNNLEVEQRKTERLVELGYDLLKFQMGMPVNDEIVLTDRIDADMELETPEDLDLEADYSEQRLETKLLRQQIKLNELDIKRNRLGSFGTLAGFASVNYTTARPRFFSLDINPNWFRSTLFGIQYNVTIFDGVQKRSRIQQTELKIDQLRNDLETFRESAMMETRSAITNVVNAYADVDNARRNLELSEEVYRISTTKYEEGIGSNLEVIDAESTLLTSQINYLTALYDYNLARIELQRVQGEFTPEQLMNNASE